MTAVKDLVMLPIWNSVSGVTSAAPAAFETLPALTFTVPPPSGRLTLIEIAVAFSPAAVSAM